MGERIKRVLLIEDDLDTVRLVRGLLAQASLATFDLVSVGTLSEALKQLSDGQFDAVLTDLSLPDYTLLRRGGYRPVGVVASTSVFYIVPTQATRRATTGWQRYQPNQELVDFTQGVYAAREMALARVNEQAVKLGAGGLVGVRLDHDIDIREVDNGGKREDLIVTFHILGTAIAPDAEHRPLEPRTIVRQGAPSR